MTKIECLAPGVVLLTRNCGEGREARVIIHADEVGCVSRDNRALMNALLTGEEYNEVWEQFSSQIPS